MPPIIRKPVLSPGPRKAFVDELWEYYHAAHRPTLREIVERIEAKERAGASSKETVRRMLRGESVPTQWLNISAVFEAMCEIANINPDEPRWEDMRSYDEPPTRTQYLSSLWNQALDEDPSPQKPSPGEAADPWDELPF